MNMRKLLPILKLKRMEPSQRREDMNMLKLLPILKLKRMELKMIWFWLHFDPNSESRVRLYHENSPVPDIAEVALTSYDKIIAAGQRYLDYHRAHKWGASVTSPLFKRIKNAVGELPNREQH